MMKYILHYIDKCIIAYITKIVLCSKYKVFFNFSFHTQKYKLYDQLQFIFIVLKKGHDWRFVNMYTAINWSTIYKTYIKLVKYDLLKESYIALLKKYLKKSPSKKLSVQMTDTSSIINKYGIDLVSYNKYESRKKISKISFITDVNGIPISVSINNGRNDGYILMEHINDLLISHELNNKYKKYMLADTIYDTKQIKKYLCDNNYIHIIPQNRKNIKNKTLITKLSTEHKNIFKKRITIEHLFGHLKKTYKRLQLRFDKISNNYLNFIYLGLIEFIYYK